MALSSETVAKLTDAITAVEEYRDKRLAEIDDEANNLRNYGVALDTLAEATTEAATDTALATIESLLA